MNGQDFQKKLKELGITQAKVAEILGVTPQTVSGMMRTASVKIGMLEKIAQGIGKDMFTFMAERLQAAGFPSFEAATLQAEQQASNKSHNKGGISAPSYNDYDGSQRKPPPQR